MNLNSYSVTIQPNYAFAEEVYLKYQTRVLQSIEHISKASNIHVQVNLDHLHKMKLHFYKIQASSLLFTLYSECVFCIKNKCGLIRFKNALEYLSKIKFEILYFTFPTIRNLDDIKWMKPLWDNVSNTSNIIFENHRHDYPFEAKLMPLSKSQYNENVNYILQALESIKNSDSFPYYLELIKYVSDIILFSGDGITGWSSPRHLGAIFIRATNNSSLHLYKNISSCSLQSAPPIPYYIEQLIHETAHIHLDLIIDEIDILVLNSEDQLFSSPIRHDKRPMKGVFHATFVLVRILLVFRLIKFTNEEEEKYVRFRSKSIKEMAINGIKTIFNHANLTLIGQQLLTEMQNIMKHDKELC